MPDFPPARHAVRHRLSGSQSGREARSDRLAYKVLAAGRRIGTPAEMRACFETALKNIKPTDAMIVGMFQQLGDQVGANAALVRELCARWR